MSQPTFILGIDPGLANTGWGIIEVAGSKKSCLAYGCISTAAGDPIDLRLKQIYDGISAVIERYHPTELGIESIFFSANAKSAIATGQARGAALVAVAGAGLEVGEYTPLQIKQTIVGNGVATKEQIQYMVRAILKLDHVPKPDHAADALGAAICHANFRNDALRRSLKKEAAR
ncbi:MAG: crossover junction endodeoxyribonuclease RuvC [bacterium]|nr:crossover junction endodeoxyribonuclease RuvC [bacterium]